MSRLALPRPDGLHQPRGYAHLVVTNAPLVHVAGQVALDVDGRTVGVGEFGAQARQAFANLAVALAAAGSTLDLLAALTIYVTATVARADLAALTAVLRDNISAHPPAITLIRVDGLLDPDWLIEVQAVAALPDPYTARERTMLAMGA